MVKIKPSQSKTSWLLVLSVCVKLLNPWILHFPQCNSMTSFVRGVMNVHIRQTSGPQSVTLVYASKSVVTKHSGFVKFPPEPQKTIATGFLFYKLSNTEINRHTHPACLMKICINGTSLGMTCFFSFQEALTLWLNQRSLLNLEVISAFWSSPIAPAGTVSFVTAAEVLEGLSLEWWAITKATHSAYEKCKFTSYFLLLHEFRHLGLWTLLKPDFVFSKMHNTNLCLQNIFCEKHLKQLDYEV